ncbi:hypothetical protein H2248_009499 [Termitomyces sp. 'cryptogamus']|nr:hypothetical protein H2248_009499 [Termitomyces sp. 'cryptogamus']
MSNSVVCQNPSCPNGNPPSRLECPTCNKLGVKGSFFCGQECFKSGCIPVPITISGNAEDGTYNPFPNYSFTGPIRPVYPLSKTRLVPDHIPRPDYAADGKPVAEARRAGQPPRLLTPEEQDKMRRSCRLAREVLDLAASHVRPGITTDELDEIVHNATIERNAYPSPLNYRNFPKSVCTYVNLFPSPETQRSNGAVLRSVNEVICHGIPDQRKLRDGDIVNIGECW